MTMFIVVSIISGFMLIFVTVSIVLIIREIIRNKKAIKKNDFLLKWDAIGQESYDNVVNEARAEGKATHSKDITLKVTYQKKGGSTDVNK